MFAVDIIGEKNKLTIFSKRRNSVLPTLKKKQKSYAFKKDPQVYQLPTYVLGSLPSSFLHLCIFMGFSNSSSRALQRVRSRSNSLCRWYTSRLRSSTLATDFCKIPFSLRSFLISNFNTRMSSNL